MVLGLRTKTRKGSSVQVNYVIHVQEIKPWPPSQSLKSLRSVVLQWENGDRNSGSLTPVVPCVGSGVVDGKIEFNESFKLSVVLSREVSARNGNADVFQRNYLELNLYEPRRDKTVKGQHLGGALIDLAEYGIIRESVVLSVPINCKRSFRNTAQPMLFIEVQPFDRDRTSTSSRESMSKAVSMDRDGTESVSTLMNEEYADEAEIASFTDDDVSSHSSLTTSSTAFEAHTDSLQQNDTSEKGVSEVVKKSVPSKGDEVSELPLESITANLVGKPESIPSPSIEDSSLQRGSSSKSSSMDFSFGSFNAENTGGLILNSKKSVDHGDQSSLSVAYEAAVDRLKYNNYNNNNNNNARSTDGDYPVAEISERVVDPKTEAKGNGGILVTELKNTDGLKHSLDEMQLEGKTKVSNTSDSEHEKEKTLRQNRNGPVEGMNNNGIHQQTMEEEPENKHVVTEEMGNFEKEKTHSTKTRDLIHHSLGNSSHTTVSNSEETRVNHLNGVSPDALRKPAGGEPLTFSRRGVGANGSTFANDRSNHLKMSVRSSLDSFGSSGSLGDYQYIEEEAENEILESAHYGSRGTIMDKAKEIRASKSFSIEKAKHVSRETQNSSSSGKIRQLERKIETLEAELRESAVVELALYSVIAEHGSSAQKVHAPARRLSRLYLHASKQWSRERRATAARSAVSGLVLVAKACGNDVPRLTFWLSNSVVLRAIIAEALQNSHLPVSTGPQIKTNGVGKEGNGKTPSLKWEFINEKCSDFAKNFEDWQDPQTFLTALEKIEAWIFSRIIESVWWQTLTPHMQSASQAVTEYKSVRFSRKANGGKPIIGDQEQGNISIDHWKKAFKDACERICPVRAGGHECGCLPVLARLVMEQCVARLDVAMFNAVLRESVDEMPTDPVSDPISDSKVLPIPAGKSSFGAGAQLKNAVGNWSRWLTDLFGIDDDDSLIDGVECDNDRQDAVASSKSFHLLNALSDLLMLPKDMLLDSSIRKEVCPTFGSPLIKRILSTFSPDEFCPDPIPESLLETLDAEEHYNYSSQDPLEMNEVSIKNLPCEASPIVYSPPSAESVSIIVGDLSIQCQLRRSRSSVLRKCQTSDDELEELDSPLTSIVVDSPRASPTSSADWETNAKVGANTVRYQLLREVWRDGD